MPTDDPHKRLPGKKPRIDPALKSTPKEKPAPDEPDDYPDEGAVRRRRDDQQEP